MLELTELDGRPFDLAAERGNVVIVNFWATWCVPCRAEMPALDSFYRAFRPRGLALIGISVDSRDDRAKVGALAPLYTLEMSLSGTGPGVLFARATTREHSRSGCGVAHEQISL